MSKQFITSTGKKFITGPGHIFNSVPTNKEEANAHGNALAASGNYPVGTSECFNVGISGGCGPDCYVYREGRCGVPQEMIERLDEEGLKLHKDIYPENKQQKCDNSPCEAIDAAMKGQP